MTAPITIAVTGEIGANQGAAPRQKKRLQERETAQIHDQ